MLRIGLHDAEQSHFKKKKTFPNYALMKISAYHKAKGDYVEWWNPLLHYDQVYSSKVFDFTKDDPYLPDNAIRGGTGYRDLEINNKLPEEIDCMFPDYSIYPDCDYAIGYITRGCVNHCKWCIVPDKEGTIKPYRQWQDIVRKDSDKLVLMDNNILASEYGLQQLKELSQTEYKIDLNQGMDARLVNDSIARILSQIKWIKFIRFSCDQKSQIKPVQWTIEMLQHYGVKTYRIFVYLLVTKDLEDAEKRVEALKQYKGVYIYAQPERNQRLGIEPNKMQLEFAQRYIYGCCYRKETWSEYCKRKGFTTDSETDAH